MDCLFMEGQIGYCCLMTTVAYVSAFPPQITVPGGGGLGMFCEVFRGLISRLNFFQSDLDRDQFNRWQNLAVSQSDVRMLLSSIEKELQVKSITFTTRLYSDLGCFSLGCLILLN